MEISGSSITVGISNNTSDPAAVAVAPTPRGKAPTRKWTDDEDILLQQAVRAQDGKNWKAISIALPDRSEVSTPKKNLNWRSLVLFINFLTFPSLYSLLTSAFTFWTLRF